MDTKAIERAQEQAAQIIPDEKHPTLFRADGTRSAMLNRACS